MKTICDNTLYLRALKVTGKKEALLLSTCFLFWHIWVHWPSDHHSNNIFCKMALLNMGIIASWIESNLMISNYISCRYVIFIFFFLAIARWRTISHADQLRAVSTAQYRLSHGKAWHVLRWRVRFLIRVVLELTIRFNLSFPCLCSVTIHSERCNIRIRQIC